MINSISKFRYSSNILSHSFNKFLGSSLQIHPNFTFSKDVAQSPPIPPVENHFPSTLPDQPQSLDREKIPNHGTDLDDTSLPSPQEIEDDPELFSAARRRAWLEATTSLSMNSVTLMGRISRIVPLKIGDFPACRFAVGTLRREYNEEKSKWDTSPVWHHVIVRHPYVAELLLSTHPPGSIVQIQNGNLEYITVKNDDGTEMEKAVIVCRYPGQVISIRRTKLPSETPKSSTTSQEENNDETKKVDPPLSEPEPEPISS